MDKQNKAFLFIAILLPILMILITAISVIYSKTDLHPQQNFIYMVKDSSDAYTCWSQLQASIFPDSADITKTNDSTAKKTIDCSSAKFYQYDFTTKQSTLVSIEQVKKMKLSPTRISPDGYVVNTYCNSSSIGGLGLFGTSYSSICIKKGNVQQRLNIKYGKDNNDEYYYFYFVGWVPDTKISSSTLEARL